MKTRKLFPAVTCVLYATILPALGNQRWESDVGWSQDRSDLGERGRYFVDVTAYLDPLTLSPAAPLGEAAFAERPRQLAGRYAYSDNRIDSVMEEGEMGAVIRPGIDETANEIGLRYLHARAAGPHVFEMGWDYRTSTARFELPDLPVFDPGAVSPVPEIDSTQQSLEAGYAYYLRDLWTVGVRGGYGWGDAEFAGGRINEVEVISGAVTSQLLHPLGGDRWLNFSATAGYQRVEMDGPIGENSESGFVGTFDCGYFFNRRTGLFLGLGMNAVDDSEAVRFGAEHFFNGNIAVRAYLGRDSGDDAEGDSDRFGLSLGCRF